MSLRKTCDGGKTKKVMPEAQVARRQTPARKKTQRHQRIGTARLLRKLSISAVRETQRDGKSLLASTSRVEGPSSSPTRRIVPVSADLRSSRHPCCICSRQKLALLGPSERALSWASLWGKADVLRLGHRLPGLTLRRPRGRSIFRQPRFAKTSA
jgi:hypothetical protein